MGAPPLGQHPPLMGSPPLRQIPPHTPIPVDGNNSVFCVCVCVNLFVD
jgi:hypothetical protein